MKQVILNPRYFVLPSDVGARENNVLGFNITCEPVNTQFSDMKVLELPNKVKIELFLYAIQF